MVVRPEALAHARDAHSRSRLWLYSHVAARVGGLSATSAASRVLAPVIRVCMPVRSPLHLLRHSFPVCVQPRSSDQPLSRSNTLLLCKLSSAVGVVFGLLLLAMCQSGLS